MARAKAKKLAKGRYEYRGFILEKDESATRGRWGYWKTDDGKFLSDSLQSFKETIDHWLEHGLEEPPRGEDGS